MTAEKDMRKLMKKTLYGPVTGLALAALALAVPAVSHAQTYTLYDLGVLGTGTNSKAFAINNNGYITGYSATAGTGSTHAFLINGNLLSPSVNNAGADLGTTGGPASNGYGLNNNQVVVGNSTPTGSTNLQGAYFNPTPNNAGVSSGNTGLLRGINDSGFAVGASNNGATAVTYQVGSGATSPDSRLLYSHRHERQHGLRGKQQQADCRLLREFVC